MYLYLSLYLVKISTSVKFIIVFMSSYFEDKYKYIYKESQYIVLCWMHNMC